MEGRKKVGKGEKSGEKSEGKNGTNWKQNSKTTDDLYYFSKNNKVSKYNLATALTFKPKILT